MGESPLVQRVHAYEEEVPKGKPIRSILANSVFVADDYNGRDRLWLELNVLEVDTSDSERLAATQAFTALATTAGAIYPVMAPYAFAATGAIKAINKLWDALEEDEDVVKVPFALYPGEAQTGQGVLQAGTYVAFKFPQEAEKYRLEKNGLLTLNGKAADVSYAVFNILPGKISSPKFLMNQKVATLLTQMKDGNANTAASTLDFLRETLGLYANYRKLERYLELKDKQEKSAEEKALMTEIGKIVDLKPFLPQ